MILPQSSDQIDIPPRKIKTAKSGPWGFIIHSREVIPPRTVRPRIRLAQSSSIIIIPLAGVSQVAHRKTLWSNNRESGGLLCHLISNFVSANSYVGCNSDKADNISFFPSRCHTISYHPSQNRYIQIREAAKKTFQSRTRIREDNLISHA